jgi:hypothetical protein
MNKTREQALEAVDLKYGVKASKAFDVLNDAQDTYNQLLAAQEDKRQEVNDYYDALEQQAAIAAIVADPPAEAS